MRIIICTPYDIREPRGNSVATVRLHDGFTSHGHEVLVLDRCEGADVGVVKEAALLFRPHVGLVMHGWRCAGSFRAIRAVSDVPLVISLRGTDLNEMMKDPTRRIVLRETLDQCDGIIVFSREALLTLAEEDQSLGRKSWVIPNGIALPEAGNGDILSWTPPKGGIVFVGIGGIRRVKNPSWLAESLVSVRESGLDIHYVHAGPVLEKEEGERFLEICRREPWVHYAGELPREQIPYLLRRSHVFVSASKSEGMPHSVTEAMLVGVPCLLSDIAGHRVFARSGREALLFRERKDFVKKAATLATDVGLQERLKTRAKERVNRMSRRGKEIESYLRLFSNLVEREPARRA